MEEHYLEALEVDWFLEHPLIDFGERVQSSAMFWEYDFYLIKKRRARATEATLQIPYFDTMFVFHPLYRCWYKRVCG